MKFSLLLKHREDGISRDLLLEVEYVTDYEERIVFNDLIGQTKSIQRITLSTGIYLIDSFEIKSEDSVTLCAVWAMRTQKIANASPPTVLSTLAKMPRFEEKELEDLRSKIISLIEHKEGQSV